jgi:hypothetical protein
VCAGFLWITPLIYDGGGAFHAGKAYGMSWSHTDLTSDGGGVAATGAMGYTTNLPGEGPAVHAVYADQNGLVHELSAVRGGPLTDANLNSWRVISDPWGYTTDLAGQGPRARVVFAAFHSYDIHELSEGGDGNWVNANLSAIAGNNPTTYWPMGYTTDLAGQGPRARVVFASMDDYHIHEMSEGGDGKWVDADLTKRAGGPGSAQDGPPWGYTTDLEGQGPVARVVYRSQPDNHVHELSEGGDGNWVDADLTAIAGGPNVGGPPMGYTTDPEGPRPVARVVYRSQPDNHVHELSKGGDGNWVDADLTAIAGGPALDGGTYGWTPFGYTTNLLGQGPAARVVYLHNGEVHELSVVDRGGWTDANLTAIAGGPTTTNFTVMGYTIDSFSPGVPDAGATGRVLYTGNDGHVIELAID